MVAALRQSLAEADSRAALNDSLLLDLNSRVKTLSESLRSAMSERDVLNQLLEKRKSIDISTKAPSEVDSLTYQKPILEPSPPPAPVEDTEALLRRTREHEAELDRLNARHARELRDAQRRAGEVLDEHRKQWISRLSGYQTLISHLDDKVRDYERPLMERMDRQQDKESEEPSTDIRRALPSCQFSLVFPPVITTIKLPIQRLAMQQHKELVCHITLPPQRLRIIHDNGVSLKKYFR